MSGYFEARLTKNAEKEGRTVSDLIRQAIVGLLRKKKRVQRFLHIKIRSEVLAYAGSGNRRKLRFIKQTGPGSAVYYKGTKR